MDWVTIIAQTGFPIAMCGYFVFRFEKILNNNTIAFKELKTQIQMGDTSGRTKRYYGK